MVNDNGIASAVMLAVTLGAVFLLLNERRVPVKRSEEENPDWRNLDPEFSAGGFEDSRIGSVTLQHRKKKRSVIDPLDFTPDIKGYVERLRDSIGDQTGNIGAILEIEWYCRKFSMLVFRRMGRSPANTSKLDTMTAADDLTKIRADIVNAIQALYISVQKERLHRILDQVTDGIMRDTAAYIRAIRMFSGNNAKNLYEGGRGFPCPWNDSADPNYDLIG